MSRPEDRGPLPLRRLPLDDDHFHDRCGLFGIFGHPEAAHLTYLGLYALQHRGQESAGIVASDGERLRLEKGMGLVNDVFTDEPARRLLPGDRAIGHVRYSTAGDTVAANAQPYLIECHRGPDRRRPQRQPGQRGDPAPRARGRGLDLPVHLRHRGHPPPLRAQPPRAARGRDRGEPVQGDGRLLAALPHPRRAGRGARPLGLPAPGARPPRTGPRSSASETCALDLIDAEYVRDVEPGEMRRRRRGRRALLPALPARAGRPVRLRARLLRPARQPGLRPQRAGLAPAPRPPARARGARRRRRRGARCPTAGWARPSASPQESGLPFEWGLIRNHYVGRTFIEPKQAIRSFGVKIKLNPVRERARGQARGADRRLDRARHHLAQDRAAWCARRARARCTCASRSPPTTGPCYYGIDTPLQSELIARHPLRRGDPAATSTPTAWPTSPTRAC